MSAELTTSEFTLERAQALTEELKTEGSVLWEKFHLAFTGRVWIALGYPDGESGWHKYLGDHFPEGPLTPPRERQLEAIEQLGTSMSNRALASVMGLSEGTIRNRKRELEQITGAQDYAPGNVQGIDGKQYGASKAQPEPGVVDAEIVDEGEQSQGSAGSGSEGSSNGRIDADRTPASEFGFEPMDIDSEQNGIQISESEVKRTISDYHLSGSSDTAQIKKTASLLGQYLTSGMVPVEVWDEDELSILAEETIDTMTALADLLIHMAEGTRTEGVSQKAITESEIHVPLAQVQQKLETLSRVVNRQSAAV